MRYVTPKQLRELATLSSEIFNADLNCCENCDGSYQKNVRRLTELANEIDTQEADNAFDLLREAKAKIDVASGIVDWTKEDVEDSGEEFFGEDITERIEELLKQQKAT